MVTPHPSRLSRRLTRTLSGGTAILITTLLAGPVAAQSSLPSAAEPRRPDLPAPAAPTAPRQGTVEIAPGPGAGPVPGAASMPLSLTRVVVEGAEALGAQGVDDLTAAITGRPITLADLFAAADAITARYRDAGWVLARAVVPAQRISDGVATIRVVEGFIARTAIDGDAGPHGETLGRYMDRLTATQAPLNIKDLERWLLLANELPGLTARAVLSPAERQTGGSVLTLKVEHDPVTAYAAIDNRGSEYSGPWRLTAGAAFNGPVDGSRVSLSGIRSLESDAEQEGATLAVDQIVGGAGTRIGVRFSAQRGRPGDVLAPLEVTTRFESFTLDLAHPVLRTRDQSLVVEGAFTAYESRTAFFGQRFSEDVVRSLSLGADYALVDGAGGSNRLRATVVQGLDILNATPDSSVDKSRDAGSAEFTRLVLEGERVQDIVDDLSARFAVLGQIADGALLSAEEFKLGGAGFGRGFDEGELSGDDGIVGLVELRYAFAVGDGATAQLYGFYDHGRVWNDDPGTTDDAEDLASVGGGVRANLLDDRLSLDLQVVKPLRRDVATEGDRDARFFASVITRF